MSDTTLPKSERSVKLEQRDASMFGSAQEQTPTSSRKRRASDAQLNSLSGSSQPGSGSRPRQSLDLTSQSGVEFEIVEIGSQYRTLAQNKALQDARVAAKQRELDTPTSGNASRGFGALRSPASLAQGWTRQVSTSEHQLQAIRMFETDLALLNTRLAPDSLFDWSTLVARTPQRQPSLTNDDILSSLRFWQFPVARAFAEIQHMYRLDVDLATLWYGDASRALFIQLAQQFEHECKVCLGVKYMNLHSLRAFTDARRKTMAYFYPYSKISSRGASSQVQEFTLAFDSAQAQRAVELTQRSRQQVRASLFAELVYSANLRPSPAQRFEVKVREPVGDFEFSQLPDGLGTYVQWACRNVGGFRGLTIQQTLVRLAMQQHVGVAAVLVHLALFQTCLMRSQSGTNLAKWTLTHLTNMYNISVQMLLQYL
jgi:hypothetical protein